MASIILLGIPYAENISNIRSLLTLSKALRKSMNVIVAFRLFFFTSSIIRRSVSMCEVVVESRFWFGLRWTSMNGKILFRSILFVIFAAMEDSAVLL